MYFKLGLLCAIFCSVAIESAAPKKEGRILNGDPGAVRPYQMFVQAFNETGTNIDYGAGVLIAPKVILTVASLILGFERWTLRYGSNIFGSLSSMDSTVAFLHPNFVSGAQINLNDLGIIILPSPVTGNANVSPISLPITEISLPRQFEEGRITNFETNLAAPSLGFTATSQLRSAFLTVYPLAECAQTFPNISAGSFCAFDDHYSSNLCTGDRGTAFAVIFRGIETLAGITSRVSTNCDDRSTFIQVQPYIDWISTVTMLGDQE